MPENVDGAHVCVALDGDVGAPPMVHGATLAPVVKIKWVELAIAFHVIILRHEQ